jgi:hypothetical protein
VSQNGVAIELVPMGLSMSEHGVGNLVLSLPDELSAASWALLLVLHAETLRAIHPIMFRW